MAADDPGFVRVPVKGENAGTISDENLPEALRSDGSLVQDVAELLDGGVVVAGPTANVALLGEEDDAEVVAAKVDELIGALIDAGLMLEGD